MGLDLGTIPDSDLHVRAGSYSGVHVHRRMMILLFIAFGPPTEREQARQWLIDKPDADAALEEISGRSGQRTGGHGMPAGIAYDNIPEALNDEVSPLLHGLWLWVNHSDCDGEHTPEETAAVSHTMNELLKADQFHSFDRDTKQWLERVADFYQEVSRRGLSVEFA